MRTRSSILCARSESALPQIDVYDVEPLPADHPLGTLPNALLTGHIAYVTDEPLQDLLPRLR
jgi:phosphoglycerate dehydrogenase-like enzyme